MITATLGPGHAGSNEESGRDMPGAYPELIYPMGTEEPFDELDPKVSVSIKTSCCLDAHWVRGEGRSSASIEVTMLQVLTKDVGCCGWLAYSAVIHASYASGRSNDQQC